MTSNRLLSGAVALGLSVALTGAFAAPSFAAPAKDATVSSSTFETISIEGRSGTFGQLTDVYSDKTEIVTVFRDGNGDKKVTKGENIVSVTETSPNGTETVTETIQGIEYVTVTATNGTVTVTYELSDRKVKAVYGTDDTVVETVTKVEKNATEGDKTGKRETVWVSTWDSAEAYDDDEDFDTQKETITFTTTNKSFKSVTVTAADGTVTETVTETTTDTIKETVTEIKADGTETSTTRVYTEKADLVTEIVKEGGKDGKVGSGNDDVVTVTETKADGTGTETVYEPGAVVTIDAQGKVSVEGKIASRRDVTETPAEPGKVTFSDNQPGSAFYASVQWMAENGISVGYADGTYKKNKDVTRGETTAFLYKYEDPTFTAPATSPFSDVNAGGAFFTPITWAVKAEITAGFKDGTFKPSQAVTRAQFAAFLYGLEDPEHTAPTTSPFGDINVGGAHFDAITWLAEEEITVGYGDKTFKPSDEITRGEISAFMQRYDANVAG